MIMVYGNGRELLDGNADFLDTNKYQAVFFRWDAPLFTSPCREDYAFKCVSGDKKLLALKVRPYDLLLFGDSALCAEAARHIIDNGLEIENFLCGKDVGDELARVLDERYGMEYAEVLAMDFMAAEETADPPCPDVVTACGEDLDELLECIGRFITDCGLTDKPDREKTARSIDRFRLIKKDGRIASMAKLEPASDGDIKITDVYTRDEYRGRGLARMTVATAMNEIFASGSVATLNVDRHNPVTNHLYRALGFKPLFSQGEYRPVKK